MRHRIDLIFDKSSLESFNLDEAIMPDNFYMSNITPLFFVECLADLEKAIRSKSTPEQLVGSLASRTPELQSYPNVHHSNILRGELAGRFDLTTVRGRVVSLAEGTFSSLIKKALFSSGVDEMAQQCRARTRRERRVAKAAIGKSRSLTCVRDDDQELRSKHNKELRRKAAATGGTQSQVSRTAAG